MQAYRIANWERYYEVSLKGKSTRGGLATDELRKSRLKYVQLRVHGHSHSPTYRKLLKASAEVGVLMELAAFGLFAKLLELAADQERGLRGWILDEKGQPVTAEQIADILGLRVAADERYVQKLLNILCSPEIGWLEFVEFCVSSGSFGEFPEKSGNSPKQGGELEEHSATQGGELYNETETELKHNENENVSGKNSSDNSARVGSVQMQVQAEVVKLLAVTDEDRTTLGDIVGQVARRVENGVIDIRVFDELLKLAGQAKGKRNPAAWFTQAAKKEPFGYKPAGAKLGGLISRWWSRQTAEAAK